MTTPARGETMKASMPMTPREIAEEAANKACLMVILAMQLRGDERTAAALNKFKGTITQMVGADYKESERHEPDNPTKN